MLTENLQTDAPSASIDASAIQLAWAQQIPALVRGSGAGIAPTTIDLLPLGAAFWPIKASRAWRLEDSRPLTPALGQRPQRQRLCAGSLDRTSKLTAVHAASFLDLDLPDQERRSMRNGVFASENVDLGVFRALGPVPTACVGIEACSCHVVARCVIGDY